MHRKHARTVAADLVERDGYRAAYLTGSVALGFHDEHSDVDLEAVVTHETYDDRDGEGGRIVRDAPDHPGGELAVEWGLTTFDRIESELGWHDDVLLYVYRNAEVLEDPTGQLRGLLADYERYPGDVRREKLFTYWFHATGNAYDAHRALERGDRATAELSLREAVEDHAALLFVLDGRFVPYRKWRRRELDALAWTPEGFGDAFDAVATGADTERKVEQLHELGDAVAPKLHEAGLDGDRIEQPYLFDPAFEPAV